MKTKLMTVVLSFLMVAALSVSAAAQGAMTTVKGKAIDRNGQPIANAVVHMESSETGKKYDLKTNKNGEFFSIGVETGIYHVQLLKDGQVLWNINKFQVTLSGNNGEGETVIPLDLQKEAQQQPAGGQAAAASAEEQKRREAAQKEAANIKNLNGMLAQANAAEQAGNYDQAVSILTQATQADPTRDLLWAKLGDAYLQAGKAATDTAQRKEKYQAAIDPYKKAIALETAAPKQDTVNLAKYYNNLGEAYAKTGQTDLAVESYQKAATTDPTGAGTYYFNLGATLTNVNKTDQAIDAFDKAIAADPNRADAYYYKGIALLGKAKLNGNKMEAPEGTAEAFNKYLELAPDGPLAEQAKQMLDAIGAKVETSYGKKKPKK
jgi:tetratricopeptide (TPR) repeat protein